MSSKNIILIGYSGHGFVVAETIFSAKGKILGYCEKEEKVLNPYNLPYLGTEMDKNIESILTKNKCFISIGSNPIREKVFQNLYKKRIIHFANAIHNTAVISQTVSIGKGVLISANATINALVQIGDGTICNTACIIEHECVIGDFAHIAPGATLAGNVNVGQRSFIGANSVIKQGITIGNDVTVGAGSVIIKDIADGETVVGNPARLLRKSN